MNGLYFYKLVSPYSEDESKQCKLTVNEIDHNFVTLKDADIKEVVFDDETFVLSLVKNNGEELRLDLASLLSGMTTDLEVDYDSIDGVITITHNGQRAVIDGLVTKDNLSSEVLTEVISDGTLSGLGSKNNPLGIASVEKTGTYKPAIKLVDIVNGEFMPKPYHLKRGDRYVTHEKVSEFGYLYNFNGVQKIQEDLKNGWRIPTKEDWDNMLNAVEPCQDYRNHNSALANNVLGKLSGKILKSTDFWINSDNLVSISCACDVDKKEEDDVFDVEFGAVKSKPNEKMIPPHGVDSLSMRLLPAGMTDGCEVVDYFGKRGYYWSQTQINETDVFVKRFDYNKAGVVQTVESPRSTFSLRLVKDYDGANHQQVEFINGMNYNTIMLPAMNTEHGFTIWTSDNVAFPNAKYHPIEPNNGEGLSSRDVYYINEWNGFDWEKKEMHEGESIVLFNGLDGDYNIEYRIMHGKLYSEAATIYNKIMSDVKPEIDRIDETMGTGFTEQVPVYETDEDGNIVYDEYGNPIIDHYETKVLSITDKVKRVDEHVNKVDATLGEGFSGTTVTEVLIQEITDRITADERLQESIDAEIASREEMLSAVTEALDAETAAREEADMLLQMALDVEISARTEADDIIKESVGLDDNGEYIPNLDGNYIASASTIAESIDMLDDALKTEEEARIEADKQVTDAIEKEAEERKEADEKLQHEIDVIESAVGLDEEGNYIKTEGYFTKDADTIVEAIDDLDTELKSEEDQRLAADTKLSLRLSKEAEIRKFEDNAIEKAVGLTKEGDYVKVEDGNYIADANSVMDAVKDLDKALKVEEDARVALENALADEVSARTEADEDLQNQIDEEVSARTEADTELYNSLVAKGEQPNGKVELIDGEWVTTESPAYDCAHGVLTLHTNANDDEHNIIIKLDGNYGEFPYDESIFGESNNKG